MKKQIIYGATTAAFIAAMSVGSAFAFSNTDLVGEKVEGMPASRTIRLDDQLRYINVNYGDVVLFEQGGNRFEWDFDGIADAVKLSQIAPQGVSVANLTIYVNQVDNPIMGQPTGE